MKILLDHCVDLRIRRHIPAHEVRRAYEMGWERLVNGHLLDAAEAQGFEVLLTVDQNIPSQQKIAHRSLALVILVGARIDNLIALVPDLLKLLPTVQPGQVYRLQQTQDAPPETP